MIGVESEKVCVGILEKMFLQARHEYKVGSFKRGLEYSKETATEIAEMEDRTLKSSDKVVQLELQCRLLMGDCLIKIGKYSEAMEEIDKVLRQNPKQVSAILSKAEALYGSGMFEKAMIQHVRGHRLRPDFRNRAFKKGMRWVLGICSS